MIKALSYRIQAPVRLQRIVNEGVPTNIRGIRAGMAAVPSCDNLILCTIPDDLRRRKTTFDLPVGSVSQLYAVAIGTNGAFVIVGCVQCVSLTTPVQ